MKISDHTIKSTIEDAVKSGLSKIDAYYLMSYLINKSKEEIFANINDRVSLIRLLKWKRIENKRLKGVPSNYITGSKEFYSLDFRVNRNVLIPRPETELVVDEVLKLKPSSLLDIGTGSGNISISVKYYIPDCRVTAVDISRAALRVARHNCKVILGSLKIDFRRSDFFSNIDESFDVIVSNPPYIPDNTLKGLQKEVSVYEPRVALSGGTDGLRAYRRIFLESGKYLKENGSLILEVSDEISDGVQSLATECGWDLISIKNDYSGIPRVAVFKLK